MSRQHISLKSRVRYEGRAQIFDRRAPRDTDLEKLPNPIWRRVNQALRSKLRLPGAGQDGDRSSSLTT